MVFKKHCILVLWTNIASALEELIVPALLTTYNLGIEDTVSAVDDDRKSIHEAQFQQPIRSFVRVDVDKMVVDIFRRKYQTNTLKNTMQQLSVCDYRMI